ncbi:SOS response-associated peptidase [Arcobacter sp. CECT 8985]|uniref:SOS response-associated peptidase n=1 Tax=Arcobacter sp. CECT 8985 TaxID=1935424 RepID=UPI00100B7F38|nr:SOS response-associated peptidase [Arcobacter sp. CECT 8985]RXJ87017.1 hypothetical protein CRU93_06430 [Arcobacter sp. CECT 8985]
MPGRLAIYDDEKFKKTVKEFIKVDLVKNLNKNYNIAPTMPIPTLLNEGTYLYAHFGFLPSWAKDKKSMNINARSESVFEKMTFRDAFKFQRCIIPINGFFEWKKDDNEKTPYYVQSKYGHSLALAGIYNEWFDEQLNQKIVTVALITCDANNKLSKIHHRMPVILNEKDFNTWLNSVNLAEVNSLFKIYDSDLINIYEVTNEVNKVLYNNCNAIKEKKRVKKGQQTLF